MSSATADTMTDALIVVFTSSTARSARCNTFKCYSKGYVLLDV